MPNKDIQPKYFDNAKFVCTTCDSIMEIGSTKAEEIRVDVCSNCHPFYTGNQQFSNTAGRVEQFKAKFAKKDELNAKKNKN
ncbi:50S ribosomal protein L31 [Williamsoniiplasma lucivorax]|uniref:50S ribosomal protein L31 n=1 Tax=Williamsoniiplasma lucivorax TaxID=209274 RepID=A0A2S5RFE1_9MOLU|nr:50S ribosomal protein L31 [Williamsoniiplasma lucivorax]PPE06030.1 50S ribosomal protein L31 [Williamsoniiplasma lucivorax]